MAFVRNGRIVVPGHDHRLSTRVARRVAPAQAVLPAEPPVVVRGALHQGAYIQHGHVAVPTREHEIITYIAGMHGFGDCVHQRALVRHFMTKGPTYLSTPWPQLYHDLIEQGLTLLKPNSALYTQAKNEKVSAKAFSGHHPPPGMRTNTVHVGYLGGGVLEHGSIVDTMCHNLSTRDFSLPVPEEWRKAARKLLGEAGINGAFAVVRPLTRRAEYPNLLQRNPDHDAYLAIAAHIRKALPLVSVADLTNPDIENAVCDPPADAKFHKGVPTEVLIGLATLATLTITAPGMMAPLSQAVGTPLVCVFGSYENAQSFAAGLRHSAYLPIEPIQPANYLGHENTPKAIDLKLALARVDGFLERIASLPPRRAMEAADPAPLNWHGVPEAVRGLFQSPTELGALARLLKGRKRVMEIGCQNGRTARVLLNSVPGIEQYIGVDIPPGSITAHARQRGEVPRQPGELAADDPRFSLLVRPRGSLAVEPYEVRWLDAVFIDGDHSTNGVERDTYLALASLKPGGLVIWHDDHDRNDVDVSAVLDGYVKTQRWPIRRIEGTWLAYMEAP
jgi:hypothetical protein